MQTEPTPTDEQGGTFDVEHARDLSDAWMPPHHLRHVFVRDLQLFAARTRHENGHVIPLRGDDDPLAPRPGAAPRDER